MTLTTCLVKTVDRRPVLDDWSKSSRASQLRQKYIKRVLQRLFHEAKVPSGISPSGRTSGQACAAFPTRHMPGMVEV